MLDKSFFSPETHHFLGPEALQVLADIIRNSDASTKIKINNATQNQADRGYDAHRMYWNKILNGDHIACFQYMSLKF